MVQSPLVVVTQRACHAWGAAFGMPTSHPLKEPYAPQLQTLAVAPGPAVVPVVRPVAPTELEAHMLVLAAMKRQQPAAHAHAKATTGTPAVDPLLLHAWSSSS